MNTLVESKFVFGFWKGYKDSYCTTINKTTMNVGAVVVAKMREAYDKAFFRGNTPNLEKALLLSNTDWDLYLRSLTEDQPTMLSDWLEIYSDRITSFKNYWFFLNLMATKIEELEEKYCAHCYHSIVLSLPEQYRFYEKMI